MTQQLWRLDDETKAAVLNHKREARYIAELKKDLADLRDIFWHHSTQEQKAWADQMIKSIVYELEEIEAGHLTVPEDWNG